MYDALYKRKQYLDALGYGLEVLGVKSLLCHFPDELKKAFVSEGEISADEVIRMLRPRPAVEMMTEKEKFVWECLMAFLDEATMKGIF